MNSISRRDLIRHSAVLGSAFAAALPLAGAEPSPAGTPRKLRIVVAGGHPGDPEYGCGGTIARFADLGHDVALLYLNRGDPNETATRPPIPVRTAEANDACGILKARPLFAGQIDGHAIVDAPHYEAFQKQLEAERPDAVFTHWPIDNHADHRSMTLLVYEAWRRMGRRFALYFYEVSNGEDTVQFAPTHRVDITATEPRKRRTCFAHASQEPDRYYTLQESVTRMRGIESGHRHAEAFAHHSQSPEIPLP